MTAVARRDVSWVLKANRALAGAAEGLQHGSPPSWTEVLASAAAGVQTIAMSLSGLSFEGEHSLPGAVCTQGLVGVGYKPPSRDNHEGLFQCKGP